MFQPAGPISVRDTNGAEAGPTWRRCVSLLRRCSDERLLRSIHALFLIHGLHRHTFPLSRLVLAACSLGGGCLLYASLILGHSPAPPNSFIFNTLIHAHARGSDPIPALQYFRLMLRSPDPSVAPDHHSFPFAIAACIAIPSFPSGTQIHTFVIKNGLVSADHFVQTAVLRLYAQNHDDLRRAQKVFDEIPQRDAVHYDVLMNGYLRRHAPSESLSLFHDMLAAGVDTDKHAITTALTSCSYAGALQQGLWIHRYLNEKHRDFLSDTYIVSALITMYAKCGCINEALKVFDEMPARNSFVWAALAGGFAAHGFAHEALRCLRRMAEDDGLRPDGIVILSAMAACAHAGLVEEGLKLLAEMEARYAVIPEHEHYSCAVDMLCRVGRLPEAVELIGKMPMRPLASVWGSLLAGCRMHNNVELAEHAVEDLQRITGQGGEDEGVFVQMSNIYLSANRREDARRIRKMIGRRGVKKTAACSVIEVNGEVCSFVAADPAHRRLPEILWILHAFLEHAGDEGFSCGLL